MRCTLALVFVVSACSQRFAIEAANGSGDAGTSVMSLLDGGSRSSSIGADTADGGLGSDELGTSRLDAGHEPSDAGNDAAQSISGLVCGDGLRVESEACDPGSYDSLPVPCSAECLPTVIDLDLSHDGETWGVHPLAITSDSSALAIASNRGAEFQLSLLVFDRNGAELAQVELDTVVNDVIDPAVAVDSGGTVAVAWSAVPDSGGGTEVRLATVRDGAVEERTVLGVFGARRNVDLLAVEGKLVAAWAEGFSDVYVQEFDWELAPLAPPQLIAGEVELEDAPSLVSLGDEWAVVWRQSDLLGECLGFATSELRVLSDAFVPGLEGERLNALVSNDGETIGVVHSVANELVGGSLLAVTEFRRAGGDYQAHGPTTIDGTEGAYAASATSAASRAFVAWRQDSDAWWAELSGSELIERRPFLSGRLTDAPDVTPKLAGSEGVLAAAWVARQETDSIVRRTQWPLPWTGAPAEYPLSTPSVF